MSKNKDISIKKKLNYRKKETNQYNLPKLKCYKSNTFN